MLNVSLATLKKFIHTGKLKTFTTPGGHHRIFKNDILFLAGHDPDQSSARNTDDIFFDLTESFMKLIETRQKFCKGHSGIVSRLAVAISRQLELPEETCRNVRLGALLHDIGKFQVSKNILNKTGRLSEEEYSSIKLHCLTGREMLKNLKPFSCVADIISQHHERFDGSGYPLGLKGDRISIEARIITLADSFDAMTSPTSYHKALTTEGAFAEVANNAGSQFDPGIVDVFLNIYKNK